MAGKPKPPADGPPAATQPRWFAVLRTTKGLRTHVPLAQEARPEPTPPAKPASKDASATEGEHPIAEARVGVVPAFMGPTVLLIAVFGVPMALREVADIPLRIISVTHSAAVGVPFVALMVLWGVLRIRGNRFFLTTSRVTFKNGLLFRRAHAIALAEVVNAHVDQGWLGKLANYGTIHLWGAGGVLVPMEGIVNPHGFQRLIEDQADAVRAQR